MSHADQVRAYCSKHYINPARPNAPATVTIRAGDVHEALGYKNRLPLVCAAIGATKFAESERLTRLEIRGPAQGANTVFVFQVHK